MLESLVKYKDEFLGIVRHALTTFGGGWVATGVITSDELGIIAGSITALVGIALSVYDKWSRRNEKVVDETPKENI